MTSKNLIQGLTPKRKVFFFVFVFVLYIFSFLTILSCDCVGLWGREGSHIIQWLEFIVSFDDRASAFST